MFYRPQSFPQSAVNHQYSFSGSFLNYIPTFYSTISKHWNIFSFLSQKHFCNCLILVPRWVLHVFFSNKSESLVFADKSASPMQTRGELIGWLPLTSRSESTQRSPDLRDGGVISACLCWLIIDSIIHVIFKDVMLCIVCSCCGCFPLFSSAAQWKQKQRELEPHCSSSKWYGGCIIGVQY